MWGLFDIEVSSFLENMYAQSVKNEEIVNLEFKRFMVYL